MAGDREREEKNTEGWRKGRDGGRGGRGGRKGAEDDGGSVGRDEEGGGREGYVWQEGRQKGGNDRNEKPAEKGAGRASEGIREGWTGLEG